MLGTADAARAILSAEPGPDDGGVGGRRFSAGSCGVIVPTVETGDPPRARRRSSIESCRFHWVTFDIELVFRSIRRRRSAPDRASSGSSTSSGRRQSMMIGTGTFRPSTSFSRRLCSLSVLQVLMSNRLSDSMTPRLTRARNCSSLTPSREGPAGRPAGPARNQGT